MADERRTAVVTVRNRQGLHMRPVDMLVRAAAKYKCEIVVEKASQKVDCRSYLAMLGLGAAEGEELRLEAIGEDAAEAIAELVELFDRRFDEPDDAMDEGG